MVGSWQLLGFVLLFPSCSVNIVSNQGTLFNVGVWVLTSHPQDVGLSGCRVGHLVPNVHPSANYNAASGGIPWLREAASREGSKGGMKTKSKALYSLLPKVPHHLDQECTTHHPHVVQMVTMGHG